MSTIASPRGSTTISNSRRTSASTDTTISRAGTGAPSQQTTRRNRAALRDYYNLKSPQDTATFSETSSPLASTFTIEDEDEDDELDRPDFSAADYVARLISTATSAPPHSSPQAQSQPTSTPAPKPKQPATAAAASTPSAAAGGGGGQTALIALLKTEAKLVSDIRRLDAERKALVYDNYSKLIAASDTIAQVMSGAGAGAGISASASAGISASVATISSPAVPRSGNPDPEAVPSTATLAPDLARIVATAQAIRAAHAQPSSQRRGADSGDPDTADADADAELLLERKRETVRWVLAAPRRLAELKDRGDATDEVDAEWGRIEKILDGWEGVAGVAELREKCLDACGRTARDTSPIS